MKEIDDIPPETWAKMDSEERQEYMKIRALYEEDRARVLAQIKDKYQDTIPQLASYLDPLSGREVAVTVTSREGHSNASAQAISHLEAYYRKVAEVNQLKLEVIESTSGEYGLKQFTFLFRNPNAWQVLQHENGIHRFRIKGSDLGRDQRAFSPELNVRVVAMPEDNSSNFISNKIRFTDSTSSGKGGQSVNTGNTKVTGQYTLMYPDGTTETITVSNQDTRDHGTNKARTIQLLRLKVQEKLDDFDQQQKKKSVANLPSGPVRSYDFVNNSGVIRFDRHSDWENERDAKNFLNRADYFQRHQLDLDLSYLRRILEVSPR